MIAGTGKTNCISRIIDEVQKSLDNNPNHEGFAFFYCNRNELNLRQPLSVLRSFVRQLATLRSNPNSMQKRIREFYTSSRQKGSEPTMSDCKELILGFLNIYPKTTLILDALDECEKHKRSELIKIFECFLMQAQNPVKIVISSREDGDIKARLREKANIRIEVSDNKEDISKYVKDEIVKHDKWSRMSPVLQADIVETLQEQSQGF